jgi:hypothetical protein
MSFYRASAVPRCRRLRARPAAGLKSPVAQPRTRGALRLGLFGQPVLHDAAVVNLVG